MADEVSEPGGQIGCRKKSMITEQLGMFLVKRFQFVQTVRRTSLTLANLPLVNSMRFGSTYPSCI